MKIPGKGIRNNITLEAKSYALTVIEKDIRSKTVISKFGLKHRSSVRLSDIPNDFRPREH